MISSDFCLLTLVDGQLRDDARPLELSDRRQCRQTEAARDESAVASKQIGGLLVRFFAAAVALESRANDLSACSRAKPGEFLLETRYARRGAAVDTCAHAMDGATKAVALQNRRLGRRERRSPHLGLVGRLTRLATLKHKMHRAAGHQQHCFGPRARAARKSADTKKRDRRFAAVVGAAAAVALLFEHTIDRECIVDVRRGTRIGKAHAHKFDATIESHDMRLKIIRLVWMRRFDDRLNATASAR